MINFQNVHTVVNQSLKPSPLSKAIKEEKDRRKIKRLANERKADRAQAAAERQRREGEQIQRTKDRSAAQAQRVKDRSAAQDQKVNARQNDLWDRYRQTGKGTIHQDGLFRYGPPAPPQGPAEPAPTPSPAVPPHIPGQGDLFAHTTLGPLAPTTRPTDSPVWPPAGHQFGLFPAPQRTPAPAPQWTQGNLFDSQPAKPQGTQGELFNNQLKPYRQARIAPHRRVAQNTPLAPVPPAVGQQAQPLGPKPGSMSGLVDAARKLSAQTWVPEGYTPPNKP